MVTTHSGTGRGTELWLHGIIRGDVTSTNFSSLAVLLWIFRRFSWVTAQRDSFLSPKRSRGLSYWLWIASRANQWRSLFVPSGQNTGATPIAPLLALMAMIICSPPRRRAS